MTEKKENTPEVIFNSLEKINHRPKAFEFYTADELWTDPYTSGKMLEYHLNGDVDLSSRNSKFIARSVKWIISQFELGHGKAVADFGCGPGLYSLPLGKSGARVTGIDFSENSLRYAQTKASEEQVSINYVHQNYLEFETEDRFDLIIMIMCDFCVLNPDQRGHLLKKFHSLLAPDGAVLLDVYSLVGFDQREESAIFQKNQLDGFWSSNDYYGFVNTFKYNKEKVTLDKYTIIEPGRERTIYNWLQYFSVESLRREFEENGFVVDSLYSDVAGTDYDKGSTEFAIVARKK